MLTEVETKVKPFIKGVWNDRIDVRDFVHKNMTRYDGDDQFLCGPTAKTAAVFAICMKAVKEEMDNGGVRAIDADVISRITSHGAGYISKENEVIVGLQTDELLKRAIKPYGGARVVENACQEHGVKLNSRVKALFANYIKSHNDGVFDAYTDEIRKYRSLGFLTGLPD
ncbi:MAG: pyruvate formate lyase family protein, partial [Bacteroidota bacterium]